MFQTTNVYNRNTRTWCLVSKLTSPWRYKPHKAPSQGRFDNSIVIPACNGQTSTMLSWYNTSWPTKKRARKAATDVTRTQLWWINLLYLASLAHLRTLALLRSGKYFYRVDPIKVAGPRLRKIESFPFIQLLRRS